MQGLTLRRVWLHAAKHQRVLQWCYPRVLMNIFIAMLLMPGTGAHAADSIISDAEQAVGEEYAIINDLDITRRVLGGDDAEIGDWPSMAAIATDGFFPFKDRFFCGGTLVAERYVLTAAHCLFDVYGQLEEISRLRVVVGIHDLLNDADFDEISVTNMIIHPDYDNALESPPNDIALLELSTEVDAPVSQLFVADSEDYVDTLGFILGWGATRYNGDSAGGYPTVLQEARVPLVSLETCNSPISYDGIVEVTQLCAGFSTGAVDTCAGDSGGPLYIFNNGQPVQVGITSFGNGCAQPEFYGIYTNISHFIPWLGNYIDVPEQSAELVASRQASAGKQSGGGALHPAVMLLLMMMAATRLTACSAQAIEETSMKKVDGQLALSARDQRAGIEALPLGSGRDALLLALPASHWHVPECRTGKTAMHGTGRLFLTEQCSVLARVPQELAGWQVTEVSWVFVARQLARIDLRLTSVDAARDDSSDSGGSAEATAGASLRQVLDGRYQRAEDDRLWLLGTDRIEFLPDSGLRFVDARLAESLPMLLDSEPDFD